MAKPQLRARRHSHQTQTTVTALKPQTSSQSNASRGSAGAWQRTEQLCLWHRAADPSENQPGAETAGFNPVQFLNLFVTQPTELLECQGRERARRAPSSAATAVFGSSPKRGSHTGERGLVSQRRDKAGLGRHQVRLPSTTAGLERPDTNHQILPTPTLLFPQQTQRKGSILIFPHCLGQSDHQVLSICARYWESISYHDRTGLVYSHFYKDLRSLLQNYY